MCNVSVCKRFINMENQQELIWNADLIIRVSFVTTLIIVVMLILFLPPTKSEKERYKRWE
jgi:hypothetical protein